MGARPREDAEPAGDQGAHLPLDLVRRGMRNDLAGTRGPRNYMNLVLRRGRMEGFIVTDFAAKFADASRDLATWAREGRLKDRVDIVEGLENAPAALRRLFTGANTGKQLIKGAD